MTYAPTLLIGLGGTGAEVLLRVKQRLRERGMEEKGLHRFLFIDTDLDTFSTGPGLPSLDADEKCQIGVDHAENFLEDPNLYDYMRDRFPEDLLQRKYIERLRKGNGASQIRSLGAFALALDAETVESKIEDAYNDLTDLSDTVQVMAEDEGAEIDNQVYIYIVGSLAGGTGSGCLIDVGVLAKEVCQASNPELAGMFALPSVFDDVVENSPGQKSSIRANTYAALKEIQFCLDAEREEREEIGSISYNYDGLNKPLSLPPSEQLFDLFFLVDKKSSRGQLSDPPDSVYSLMARSILLDVGSPFGTSAKSFESNVQELIGINPCPETGEDRLFGTISNSALVYPASRLARYCAYRTSAAFVKDRLMGTSPPEDKLEGEVSDFLEDHDLESRGGENQLLKSLLQVENRRSLEEPAPKEGEVVRSTWFEESIDFGEDLDPEKFTARIEEEWSHHSKNTLGDIESTVDQNLDYRRGDTDSSPDQPLQSIVKELAVSAANKHSGAQAAIDTLELLAEVADEMHEEFRKEEEEWETREEVLKQEFEEAADDLSQLGSIRAFFTGRDEELKKQLVNLYNQYVRESIWAVARSKAKLLLRDLSTVVQKVKEEWDGLRTEFQNLRKSHKQEARGLEKNKEQSGLVVEQEITRPGHERRYYEEKRSELDPNTELSLTYKDLFEEALNSDVEDFGKEVLYESFHNWYENELSDLDIVRFAEENPTELRGESNSLKQLLGILSDQLSQPFWPAKEKGPAGFSKFLAISAPYIEIDDDSNPDYAPVIEDWKNTYGYEAIASQDNKEIKLGSRYYGARAYYLTPCEYWKVDYEKRQKTSKGRYMNESHAAFQDIPDLFPPEDIRPLRYFALGVALGFIVQRGDWYYFGLKKPLFGEKEDQIRVLYEGQSWTSVFDLNSEWSAPSEVGKLDFSRREYGVDKERHQLAQGRENAIEALGEEDDYIDLLERSVNEYHRNIGSKTFSKQLYEYSEDVLWDEYKSTGNDVFSKEYEQVKKKLSEIGP